MENPCLTFVTPTLIAGDRSLANVVAHEIAHSWTGNLVSPSTWNGFWLNEGEWRSPNPAARGLAAACHRASPRPSSTPSRPRSQFRCVLLPAPAAGWTMMLQRMIAAALYGGEPALQFDAFSGAGDMEDSIAMFMARGQTEFTKL